MLAALRQYSQPQLTRGLVGTGGCPSAALTPRFPRRGLSRPPAAPLRGEEASAMAGVFRRTINLPTSHASQLQPGSDLYAAEVHQREKYFPGTAYPPFPSLFLTGASCPRPEPGQKPEAPSITPACHPLPSPPSPGAPPLPGICEQKKTSSGFLASVTH